VRIEFDYGYAVNVTPQPEKHTLDGQTRPRLKVDRATVFVCLYAAIQFLYGWWTNSFNPIWRTGIDKGWFGWPDQSNYLQIARDLAQGHVTRPLYYGPGYPVLAIPFLGVLPQDPFLVPNLLLYILSMVLYYRIARKFLSTEVSVLAIVLLGQGVQFLDFFVEPWGNVVAVAAVAILLYSVVYPARRAYLAAALVGVCVAWTFAARYGDALALVPLALYAVLALRPTWRDRFRLSLTALAAALPILIWVGFIHQTAFGAPFATPYQLHLDPTTGLSGQDFAGRSIRYVGYHLFSLLVNPHVFDTRVIYDNIVHGMGDHALLADSFVIVLAGVGLAFWRRREPRLVYAYALSFGMGLLLYGTYWATAGSDLKYHALRFLAPWQPMLVVSSVGGVSLLRFDWRVGAERRAAFGGVGLGVAFISGLYLLGRWLPPFPDTAQILSPQHWSAAATVNKEQAALAIDGNAATGWKSNDALPAGARFKIDFPQLSQIDRLFLVQRIGVSPTEVSSTVEVSADGNNWHAPANLQVHSPEPRIVEFTFDPTAARYVRFVLTADTSDKGWAIDEIYGYGRPLSSQ
jgi:hypothetical protein